MWLWGHANPSGSNQSGIVQNDRCSHSENKMFLFLDARQQTLFLVHGCRWTFTVKQLMPWFKPWEDSWPLISPTNPSTSCPLTTWLSCLLSIYLKVGFRKYLTLKKDNAFIFLFGNMCFLSPQCWPCGAAVPGGGF